MPSPSRSLNLEGFGDFRDLGGFPATAGQQMRWRHLFRSDQLSVLTEHDLQRLEPLGLARAFDLRGVHERAATPHQLPGVVQHAQRAPLEVVQVLWRVQREFLNAALNAVEADWGGIGR